MPTYSGGNDKSDKRDQPFTGDGGREVNQNRLPDKGEIVVRTKGGSAQLSQTRDLFEKKKPVKVVGKHRK